MRWIVTGATGLIGRHLVPVLASKVRHVVAWSRTAESSPACRASNVEARNVDLSARVPSVAGDDDVGLIALAAKISGTKDPAALAESMRTDALAHLRLAASLGPRLKHVVFAGSCTVYGYIRDGASRETDALRPLNAYSIEKVAAEFLLAELARTQGFALTVLRISQVYGEGAPTSGAFYDFVRAAGTDGPVAVNVGPDVFRDFVHVDDVVRAIVAAIDGRVAGTFNVGGGKATLVDVARAALRAAGRTDEPQVLARSTAGSMALDLSLARDRLGHAPAVSLDEGVRREFERLRRGA